MRRNHVLRFVIYGIAAFGAASAHAGELRPFILPSQNAPSLTAGQRPIGVSNSYYDKFAADAARMDKKQTEGLKTDFLKRLGEARNSQHYDEQAHYERMIGILEGQRK